MIMEIYVIFCQIIIIFSNLTHGIGLLVEKENDIQRLHSELEAARSSAAFMKVEGDEEESTERLLAAQGIITTLENRHKDQEQKIGIVDLMKA
jgi:hypothetical protein